ncbi:MULTISPECIES: group-specific protein [Sporosarcina]|uniref:Group-specific protein n=1 Tax=Sporosarcina contaminans TaxID=633403 RepID=A0ABW3TZ19_9BACL
MKFYIASCFANIENVTMLSNALKSKGHIHTYDWTKNGRAYSFELLSKIGEEEKMAVKDSDFLVLLLPAGKGSHIEFGMALSLGKRIYLYSPTNELFDFDKTSTFYHVEGVDKFVGTLDSFQEYIIECEK